MHAIQQQQQPVELALSQEAAHASASYGVMRDAASGSHGRELPPCDERGSLTQPHAAALKCGQAVPS